MKIKVFLLATALIVGVAGAPQSVAATSILSMQVRQTPSASESLLTMYGNLKPNKSGVTVKIQVDTDGKWTTTRFATKVTKVGNVTPSGFSCAKTTTSFSERCCCKYSSQFKPKKPLPPTTKFFSMTRTNAIYFMLRFTH